MHRVSPDGTPGGRPQAPGAFRLITLGRLALVDASGREHPSLATRPRKVALLSWLALRPAMRASRDRLTGVFWAERDDERARNSLSDALSHLRRVLGRDALQNQADDVRIAECAPLAVDALELAVAAAAGDHERVVALHAGVFLDGVYVDDAPEFDDWRDRERVRLAGLFARSAAVRGEMLKRAAAWDECRTLAERWLELEPASSAAALMVLRAMVLPGTHEADVAALAHYDALVVRLERDVGVPPHASVTELASEIRYRVVEQSAPWQPVPADVVPVSPESITPTLPARTADVTVPSAHMPPKLRQRRSRVTTAKVGGALSVFAALAFASLRQPQTAGEANALDERRIFVAPFSNDTGDSTLTALGRMAVDRINRSLSTARVAEVFEPMMPLSVGSSSPRAIGESVGAAYVVFGRYFARGDSIGVEARLVSARDGRVLRFVEAAMSPREQPDQAIDSVGDRVASAVAVELDVVLSGLVREGSQPRTLASYRPYAEGMDLFIQRNFDAATSAFLRAASVDTNFHSARVWAVASYGNSGEPALADSLSRAVDAVRDRLMPFDRAIHDYWKANLAGDRSARYEAAQDGLRAAPASELMLFLAGFAALGVNRPEEAIRLLRRIRPGRSADVWDDFGTRLPFALHLTGRFEEELRDAANRRGRKRLLLGAIGDEARALAALGRLAAVDRLMLEVATLPADGPRTPGHVMFDAAQELRAHGHEQEATALFRRAATWARTQTTTESAGSHTAALLARALQQSGDYATADSIHRARLSENPSRVDDLGWSGVSAARRRDTAEARNFMRRLGALDTPYLRGVNTLWCAKIAAVLGNKDEAVRLLSQAMAKGVSVEDAHTWAEMSALRGHAPYEELVRPKG